METKGRRAAREPVMETAAATGPEPAEMAAPQGEAVAAAPADLPPPVPAALPQVVENAAQATRDLGEEALAAFSESQAAVARGLEAMTAEIGELARAGIAAATRSATAMLSAKSLSDAFEINMNCARQSLDALIDGSAKLSEIGVKLASEASRPVLAQCAQGWGMAR